MLNLASILLAPPTCSGCGATGRDWCQQCAAIVPVPQWIGMGVPVLTCFTFSGPVRRTIIDWKEEGRRAARQRVEAWLAAGLQPLAEGWPQALFVPIPSSAASERQRGGRVLAAALCAVLPRDQVCEELRAVRPRADQAGLSRLQRERNLRGAMQWDGPHNRPLIVVDDIITSGATMREGVRAIRASGRLQVIGFALARR